MNKSEYIFVCYYMYEKQHLWRGEEKQQQPI